MKKIINTGLSISSSEMSRRQSNETAIPLSRERVKQQIEDIAIDDIDTFLLSIHSIADIKQVLRQLLYIQRIDKEVIHATSDSGVNRIGHGRQR